MTSSSVYVFNQYYFDLLRKVKDVARDMKHKADDKDARDVLREIKKWYLSFDRSSDEYLLWFKSQMQVFNSSIISEEFDVSDWYKSEVLLVLQPYHGITVDMLGKLIRTKEVLLYYFILMSIFSSDNLSEEKVAKLVEMLKTKQVNAEQLNELDDMELQRKMILLNSIQKHATTSHSSGGASQGAANAFKDIESTSLGQLAKEIMSEVNVDEIQKNVGEDGDILKALGNPDSGLTKLLGTVSQKMISKIASGELKQETLLQDAMKLATSIPGMMPGAGGNGGKGGGGLGGLGDMASMFESVNKIASMFGAGNGGSGGDSDLDFGSMMQQLAGGMGGGKTPKGAKKQINQSAMSRVAQAKQLRHKLEERRKRKENIE